MTRVLVAALILVWATPGEASMIYHFTTTGRTAGIAVAEASIEFDDAAARDGLRITANERDAPQDWAALGLLGLSFMVNGQHVGLPDLAQAAVPYSMLSWNLDLRSAGGAPTGALHFSTGEWSMAWRLDGARSAGQFETDDPGISRSCTMTGACSFTGVFAAAIPASAPGARGTEAVPVVVPEPAALALFGLGLAGLAIAGRRWSLASERGRTGL